MIRRATRADASEMSRIYNQATRPGVFAINIASPDTYEDRLAWLGEHQDPYPAFVYTTKTGRVIGWCSLSRFAVRPEYTEVAETSRYIDEDHRGKGIGQLMFAHLIETATRLGFRLLVSRAYEKNARTIRTTIPFGFKPVAVLHEMTRMHDEWQNEVFLWKKLR